MYLNFKNIIISEKKNIRDAMKRISKSKIKTLLVVNKNNQLLGTITDGDIRRYISKKDNFNVTLNYVANLNPSVVYKEDLKNKNKLKKINKKLEIIPLISNDRTILDILTYYKINNYISSVSENYTVIIFAGGKGKRLMPLTKDTPKPMLKINNTPILELIITRLNKIGFKNIVLSVNYKSSKIKQYFKDGSKFGINLAYIEEKKELGTAGSLSLLSLTNNKSSENLLVINGDILTKLNYKNIIDFHINHSSDLTIATREFSNQIPFGVLQSKKNRLISIEEKPISNFQVNAGIYVIKRKLLDLLKFEKNIDMPEFINLALKDKKKIMCYTINDYWKDIGTPRDLDIAKSEYDTVFEKF